MMASYEYKIGPQWLEIGEKLLLKNEEVRHRLSVYVRKLFFVRTKKPNPKMNTTSQAPRSTLRPVASSRINPGPSKANQIKNNILGRKVGVYLDNKIILKVEKGDLC